MIRIKVVDEQNIVEVCKLTANHKGGDFAAEGCKACNALSIAEAKFLPEMHLNAIYHNQVLIGFFQYQRAEDHADLATIRRFMIGEPFRHKGLGKEALAYALKGLKIQGVKKVLLRIEDANEIAKKLCLSLGFVRTGKTEQKECCYARAL